MKTVVITGSARGFGYAMLDEFYKKGYNVVMCDVSEDALREGYAKMSEQKGDGKIFVYRVDITNAEEVSRVINDVKTRTGSIDIWINNAGVNQPNKPVWELDKNTIDRLIDIDIKGTVLCTKLIMPVMISQGSGQIYNVEGHGSNDALITGLSLYGTSKRAITYYTEALAHEVKDLKLPICIGKITPGIMITNFIHTALGDGEKIALDDKTKKIYNILGDYPETIAKFMVEKITVNTKNNVKFTWLTKTRAMSRFMLAGFNKRDFFKDDKN